MKQILFELGTEVCFGIVNHEGQHIGVCQRVLLIEREKQMLPNLVLGIQLNAHIISVLI